MAVYHGTTLESAAHMVASPVVASGLICGLYVAPSAELASRYANARATGIVDAAAAVLMPHAALLELDHDDCEFQTRDNNASAETATSLDAAEATIPRGSALRIVRVVTKECEYPNCVCHIHAAFLRGDAEAAREQAAQHKRKYGPYAALNYLMM